MRGGPGFWPLFASGDIREAQSAAELAAKAMEAVKIMGGDTLLIVPGQWDAGASYDTTFQSALDTAKRVADAATKSGIKVGLENVENKFLLSPRDWTSLLDAVGSSMVRMYFDVGNTVYLGRAGRNSGFRELGKKYITRIHFKDAIIAARFAICSKAGQLAGGGIGDEEIGYEDWVGLELNLPAHHPAAMLAGNCRAVRDILK